MRAYGTNYLFILKKLRNQFDIPRDNQYFVKI